MSELCQVWKAFSSSLWLCDCHPHFSVKRDVSDDNSMGLILDARNVHFDTTFFGSEHSYLPDSGSCSWCCWIGCVCLVEQARFILPLRST